MISSPITEHLMHLVWWRTMTSARWTVPSKTLPVLLFSLFWWFFFLLGQWWHSSSWLSAFCFISERRVKRLQPETEHLAWIRLNWDNVSPLPFFEPEVKTRFYVIVVATLWDGAIFAMMLREKTEEHLQKSHEPRPNSGVSFLEIDLR